LQQACEAITDIARTIYLRLDAVAKQLLAASQSALVQWELPPLHIPSSLANSLQVPATLDVGAWLCAACATPAALWTLGCLAAMVWVAMEASKQLVATDGDSKRSTAHGSGTAGEASTSSVPVGDEPGGDGDSGTEGYRRRCVFSHPAVPLLAVTCALLLRISWVPASSLAGSVEGALGAGIYAPAALIVTSATTFISFASACKLLGANLAQPRETLEELLSAVKGVVAWHRALLLLDWLLALAGPLPLAVKGQLLISFGLYGVSVDWLTGRAEALSELLA